MSATGFGAKVRAGLVAAVVAAAVAAQAPAQAAPLLVDQDTLHGWELADDNCTGGTTTGSTAFVTGPATPPLSAGSVELSVGADGDSYPRVQRADLAGTLLSDITALSYSSYITTPGAGLQAPYIEVWVDLDGSGTYDGAILDGGTDDLLFFEPQFNDGLAIGDPVPAQAVPAAGSWQAWDAANGGWYSYNASGGYGPPVVTLANYAATNPTAAIANNAVGDAGFRLGAGCGGSDWAGFEGSIDAVTIGIAGVDTEYDFDPDVIAPDTPLITTPTELQGFAPGSSVYISGTAEPGSTVIIEEISSDVPWDTVTADSSGAWSTTIAGLQERRWVIEVRAVDAYDNESDNANRSFDIDRNVPVITSPTGGLNPSPTQVRGTGKPGSTVQIFLDVTGAQPVSTKVLANGTWYADMALSTGTHTIKARGTAATGNASFGNKVTFTVDAVRPTVAITTTTSAFGPTDVLQFDGTASDNGSVVRVELAYYDVKNIKIATGTATGTTAWTHNPTLIPGRYRVQAVAIDNAGNASNPANFEFTTLALPTL